MKRNILGYILLLITLTVTGQNYKDIIYLKDSTIIEGVILKQVFQDSIVFVNTDLDTVHYKMSQIEKLLRLEAGMDTTINPIQVKYWPHRQLIFQYSYFFGCGEYSNDFTRISIVNGFRFNSTFSFGLGIGLNYSPQELDIPQYSVVSGAERKSIPAFLDFRWYFNTTEKLGEYITLDFGYSFTGTYDYFFLSPSIGFVSKSKPSVHFGLGYEMNYKKFEITDNSARYHIPSFPTKLLSYVSINVGINF